MSFPLELEGVLVQAKGREKPLLAVSRLHIEAGSCVALYGASGAGKTTMLMVAAGLLEPDAGRVAWNGANLSSMTRAGRARFRRDHIGLVFQDFLLFEELTADENAHIQARYALPTKRAAITDAAAKALRRLGIERSDRSVDTFSGGEKQRVAVARALSTNPKILLADEPTASLDRPTANSLIRDLVELVREAGKTMLVITHDPGVLERMDRVIHVVDGEVSGGATP